MSGWCLAPREGGYYTDCGPTAGLVVYLDLDFLLDADSHVYQKSGRDTCTGVCLRRDVLVVPAEDAA